MKPSNLIAINTIAQYSRTVINAVLSLYSARLVLNILGIDDYGLYSLIAGFVAMSSFFTNSLAISTQRFLSVAHGENDRLKIRELFFNSLIIHVSISVALGIVLICLTPFLFDGFLNIPLNSYNIAKKLYYITIAILFISFIISPYRAALISRENIVYISAVDVIDGVLKLVLVLLLPYSPINKLITYGYLLLFIRLINYFAFKIFCQAKYSECAGFNLKYIQWKNCKSIISFAGWTVYSNFCTVARDQGFTILLNKIYSTALNAAFGIAIQLSGYLYTIGSSFMTAIAPQLMKAEGGNNRSRALYLSAFQSKISLMMFGVIGIPIIFEMQSLLSLWLKEVPPHTALFGTMFVIAAICDQPTLGLWTLVNATGKIKNYILITYTPKFIILPLGWFLLSFCKLPLWTIAVSYIMIEIICMLLRLPILKKIVDLDIHKYLSYVLPKLILPYVITISICLIIHLFISLKYRFILTFGISMPIYCLLCYWFALTDNEKANAKNMINTLMKKMHIISKEC